MRYRDDSPSKKRQRILALDLLRGLFMLCIIINHNAGWSPSFLNIFTGQGALFASAAEGFFAISGILVGYIYGPKILRNRKIIFKKLWLRAGLLYLLAVGLTILFTLWNLATPEVNFRLTPWSGNLTDFLTQTLTLQFGFGWHEYLRQYAVYMFIAPFALFACAIRKWWIIILISTFVLLFVGHQGVFNPFASWQAIFLYSLVIGFYLPLIEKYWSNLQNTTRRVLVISLVSLAAASYLFSVAIFTITPAIINTIGVLMPIDILAFLEKVITFRDDHILPYFQPRENLPFIRLFFGCLWFSALYIVFRKYENSIDIYTKGILSFFGKNSLVIFCLHAVLLFLQDMLIGQQFMINMYLNTIIHINFAVTVYVVMYAWQKYRRTTKPIFDVK